MTEHRAKIKALVSDSKLAQHIQQNKHKFDFLEVETFAWKTDLRKRVIKESIFTHKIFSNVIKNTKHTLHVFE